MWVNVANAIAAGVLVGFSCFTPDYVGIMAVFLYVVGALWVETVYVHDRDSRRTSRKE